MSKKDQQPQQEPKAAQEEKPSRAIKDLVVSKSKELSCQSCSNRAYKQQAKLNVSRRSDQDGAETAERWWQRNRARLSEDGKLSYATREDEILHLTQALTEH